MCVSTGDTCSAPTIEVHYSLVVAAVDLLLPTAGALLVVGVCAVAVQLQ
jgi:hypothetical protein